MNRFRNNSTNNYDDILLADELNDENVIADVFDPRVVERESEAVAKAAIESGVARIKEVI